VLAVQSEGCGDTANCSANPVLVDLLYPVDAYDSDTCSRSLRTTGRHQDRVRRKD